MSVYRIVEDFTADLEWGPDVQLSPFWEIYNAARPFPAHFNWQGRFLHGVFYGAIDPELSGADEYRERAKSLDAHLLVWVTREEVEAWGRAYCEKHGVNYGDFDYEEIARSYLRHAEKGDSDE
jgi:hypothetical protein